MNSEIILEIILVLIGLYLAMFKSYFQEKGKNIATSEDIEKLTLKVESIKQQFLEKNAVLKAKLDLLTNLQINHKNEKRLALIDFHKKIKSWIGLLTESIPSLVDNYDNNEIQAKIHFYDLTYRQVLASEALLELYLYDEKLAKLIRDLKTKILEHLAQHPPIFLLELKYVNIQINKLEGEKDYVKIADAHKELLDKRKVIFEECNKKMMIGYKIVLNSELEYNDYVRDYISKIPIE
jgi:hypothetical protein